MKHIVDNPPEKPYTPILITFTNWMLYFTGDQRTFSKVVVCENVRFLEPGWMKDRRRRKQGFIISAVTKISFQPKSHFWWYIMNGNLVQPCHGMTLGRMMSRRNGKYGQFVVWQILVPLCCAVPKKAFLRLA